MIKLYCQDWYNNKYITVSTNREISDFKIWDKLVYSLPNSDKQSLAIYLWFEDKWNILDRWWELLDKLSSDDLKYFDKMHLKAQEKFKLFKTRFKKKFPDTIPVVARYHIFAEQYYFFFYAEQRFNFADFVREFRSELWANFFLFQVWARDMVKMSPATDCIIWCWWGKLCCKSNRVLPSIDIEILIAQHLEWRDIERLKWRCWKLKCCLMYEAELYLTENKKYPKFGNNYSSELCEKCHVSSFNIINGKIQLKDDNWWYFSIDLDELKRDWKKLEDTDKREFHRANKTENKVIKTKDIKKK